MYLGTAPCPTESIAGRFVCPGHIVNFPSASAAFKLSRMNLQGTRGFQGLPLR
ncbi:hypothetical protein TorRG33x02_089850 [Trema orientale]|uniref:Uncharacterized protein n=1 Tax=Trema orientale TaxID=63057 RepID=A0A2P5FBC9_TREOI|nr:hypothetical protein TorRG33x02_089850 [Trema orientale]